MSATDGEAKDGGVAPPTSDFSSSAPSQSDSSKKDLTGNVPNKSQDAQISLDCCICAETALHPVKLPCSHMFCFLCIKGCFVTDGHCPLCRADIDPKAIESPMLVGPDGVSLKQKRKRPDSDANPSASEKSKSPSTRPTITVIQLDDDDISSETRAPLGWFYEGRGGGWWQYDERTSAAIDDAVSRGLSSLEVMLAGHIYVLDFVALVQMQKDNPAIKRRMKHGCPDSSTKGIAGITKEKLACG